SLSTIGAAGVTVNQVGNIYTAVFNGSALAGTNVPQLVATVPPSSGTVVTVSTLVDGDGTALELQTPNALFAGGEPTGLHVWYEQLLVDSLGNATFGAAPLAVLNNDNMGRGPVSLNLSTTLQIQSGARLDLFGTIDDVANPSPSGSNLTMAGGG